MHSVYNILLADVIQTHTSFVLVDTEKGIHTIFMKLKFHMFLKFPIIRQQAVNSINIITYRALTHIPYNDIC